ncbi:MAG: branched-chain amino acid ABC transporter permease, partial [Sulfolobales archaeon]
MEIVPPVVLYILVDFSVYLIVTLSLNIEAGYAGLPQFGRVLAVITGALVAGAIPGRILAALYGYPYGAEYAYYEFNYKIVNDINSILENSPILSIGIFLITLLIAMALGAAIGYLTSRPAIRLKEAYLGITLLAMGDVVMLISL